MTCEGLYCYKAHVQFLPYNKQPNDKRTISVTDIIFFQLQTQRDCHAGEKLELGEASWLVTLGCSLQEPKAQHEAGNGEQGHSLNRARLLQVKVG